MQYVHTFRDDRRGNFAMLSAILSIPLVLGAGVALDFATLSRTKSSLQQAMDSAALAIAREGTLLSNVQAQAIAHDFLDENFDRKYTDLAVGREGTAVSVDARTMVPLAFGSLFGYEVWPVQAASAADIAYATYEVGLVLDTTGSMKGGKLTAMKEAVEGLVETMAAQVNDADKLQFAVVPFANFVNVGPDYGPKFDSHGKMIPGTGAPWLDLAGVTPVPQLELAGVSRFEIFNNLGQKWAGCVETRIAAGGKAHDTDDTPATAADKASLFVPAFGIDEPSTGGYANDYIATDIDPLDMSKATKVKKLKKYGVPGKKIAAVTELTPLVPPAEASDESWDAVSASVTSTRGPNQACVTQPIMPLTNAYATVVSKVNSLQANGTTNIMEGVAWGMRVLSPGEPFAQAADKKTVGIEKIMIVLTDGANVFGNNSTALGSAYASRGYLADGRLGIDAGSASDTNALMNEKTLEACTNAKAAGIQVYTIRLEEPDVATGTMLAECASSPLHYFDAPSRTQLDEVFQTIKDRIVRVRLAS